MILRRHLGEPNRLIGAGQLALVLALVADRFVHPQADFWQGFVAGLSGVLIGLSIVLNLRGLVLWRRSRDGGGPPGQPL